MISAWRFASRVVVAVALLAMAFAPSRAADVDEKSVENNNDEKLEREARASLQKAVAWLMTKQTREGSFPSETYGSLRQGAATTALVLYALAHVPEPLRAKHSGRLADAYSFLRTGIAKAGCVANADGSLDYPTYGSAMTLEAARRLKLAMTDEERRTLRDFVLQAQLDERRKFAPDSPHYGGWDLMGASMLEGVTSGTNVSVSSFALEALTADDSPEADAARSKALRWATRCQAVSFDGGFPFTPVAGSESNKAETDDDREKPRPYGTTTCDGLRCLLYAGAKPGDKHVEAAASWLAAHDKLDRVPGFDDVDERVGWQKGLLLYYYFSLAKCLKHLPPKTAKARRGALLAELIKVQKKDGRWQNESARMREDDPLIATSLVVAAMGEILDR